MRGGGGTRPSLEVLQKLSSQRSLPTGRPKMLHNDSEDHIGGGGVLE